MDVHSKKQRSFNMSRISGKNTKPEIIIEKLLFDLHIPFIKHPSIVGNPDFYIPDIDLVIEVYGCFWHKHDCKLFKIPTSNRSFWLSKLTQNQIRDKTYKKKFKHAGLNLYVIWECSIKNGTFFEKFLDELIIQKAKKFS